MPRARVLFSIAWFLTFQSLLMLEAQEAFDVETVSMDSERMIKYPDAEGKKVSREAWERISTRQKLDSARDDLHREFLFMIGLDPLPPRTPLEMTQVRTVDRQEYTIDVLHYQSLPGFYVTANLYKPKIGGGPFPRGLGSTIWDAKLLKRFRRSAMPLGRTLDEMRLYDVLCAVDQVASDPSFNGRELTGVGRGVSGLLGVYAALLGSRITRVILHSPPLTHKEGPVFLNILRYTDVPQVLAMLTPKEIVFLTHEIEHFGYTRNIYSLYGAEKRFRKCATVPQALNLQDQRPP